MGIGTDTNRTTFRPRQLHDLNRKPSATDARPAFFWSAEQPNDFVPTQSKFPGLMWAPADRYGAQQEITVYSQQEFDAHAEMGYTNIPPEHQAMDPMDAIQAQFDALSPEDQKLMLEAQAQSKRAQLQAKLATLTESDLERLLVGASEEKRRPGRPRKTA